MYLTQGMTWKVISLDNQLYIQQQLQFESFIMQKMFIDFFYVVYWWNIVWILFKNRLLADVTLESRFFHTTHTDLSKRNKWMKVK